MWLWRMRENETIGAVFNDEINRVLLVIGFSCRYISVHRRILRRFHHLISDGADGRESERGRRAALFFRIAVV